jgi:LAO/AO transport system kinase
MAAGGDPQALLRSARAGNPRAVGRLLSMVERGGPAGRAVGRLAFAPSADVEMVVGITGAPGAGKSTLTDRLITRVRASSRAVGVLAVDPSSPFSGGAILGDRLRMGDHSGDRGVFVRSMATRGHLGGLALAVPEAIRVLAAVGMPVVLVETVGVGQAEVEVAGAADTTVVVVNPGWGDDVQASKAGLLEVADVFVVNKADRPGAEAARRDLEAMLDLGVPGAGVAEVGGGAEAAGAGRAGGVGRPTWPDWRPPVVLTVASSGEGVSGLWAAAEAHRAHLVASGQLALRREQRLVDETTGVLVRRLERDAAALWHSRAGAEVIDRLRDRTLDPYDAAEELLSTLGPPLVRPDPRAAGPTGGPAARADRSRSG